MPAPSVAQTLKLWGPSTSGPTAWGELQYPARLPSTLHMKVEPASEEVNATLPVLSLVRLAGPEVIVVSGGVVSAAVTVTTTEA